MVRLAETSQPVRLKFYGQNGEDALLWRFFNKPHGFYVDVGAFDGKYLSNSLIFEQAGWDGICVEALPQYADFCRQNRPRAKVVSAAITGDGQGSLDLVADSTGLFTGQTPPREEVAGHFKASGLPEPEWETVRVPTATLNELLEDAPPIDFLSLDIEGGEEQVIESLDFDRHAPRVLLLENPTEVMNEILAAHGYRLARSLLWNSFFARGEDIDRLRDIHALAWLQRPAHPIRPELSAVGYPGRRFRYM